MSRLEDLLEPVFEGAERHRAASGARYFNSRGEDEQFATSNQDFDLGRFRAVFAAT
jgi:hypothetical protein